MCSFAAYPHLPTKMLKTPVNTGDAEGWPDINTDITPAAEFTAMPVLIQSNGGMVTVQGAEDGTLVSIYTSAGMQAGSTVSRNGMATLSTSLQTGSVAIIKIGERTVKVIMR